MKSGLITVITGPMFSEKSGQLIDRCLKLEKFGGKKVRVYKPSKDTRFGQGKVVSRMGYEYPATDVPEKLSNEIVDQILKETETDDVVGFDEAQFFNKPIMKLVGELAYRGKHVIVDGLNTDYSGKEFGFMGGLLTMAEEIVLLKAFCAVCKSPNATFTQRMEYGKPAKLGDIVQIGDSESYEPRCRCCYIPPDKA